MCLHNTKVQLALGAVAVGLGAFHLLLRARVVPKKMMQYWFVLTVLATIFAMSGVLLLTDPLRWIGFPKYYLDRFNVVIMSWAFRVCWRLNPQVKMHVTFDDDTADTPAQERGWAKVSNHGIAITLNHTSFWDIVAFICMTPYSHLIHTRTLMKDSLRKIPVFGGVFDRVGHFPVYFKSDEDGNFQVDKERQAEVQKGVDQHINEGGCIAIFPEGAISKTPAKLQTFRYGTFHTIFQHKMKTYYMVAVGNDKTWPGRAPVGGLPADIHIRFGSYPIDFDTQDSKEVALSMRNHMQKVYDEIAAEAEKKTQ